MKKATYAVVGILLLSAAVLGDTHSASVDVVVDTRNYVSEISIDVGGASPHCIIGWTSITNSVYNVLWTPSLMQPFQPLGIGIVYPFNSYTDLVHAAESAGFYCVEIK